MTNGYEPFCSFKSIMACSLHKDSTCPRTCNLAQEYKLNSEIPSNEQYFGLEADVQKAKSLSV